MFGIGFTEILLLALIGLVVLGPRRLPEIARGIGYWSGRARSAWAGLQREFQAEMDAEHNRRILEAARQARDEMEQLTVGVDRKDDGERQRD